MFACKTRDLPVLNSWIHANSYFHKTKPWRDSTRSDERPLDMNNRRKRHMSIVKVGEDYECRLYGTTLLKYWENDRITIRAYATQSSQKFVNAVCPSNVAVQFAINSGSDVLVLIDRSVGGPPAFDWTAWPAGRSTSNPEEYRAAHRSHDAAYQAWQAASQNFYQLKDNTIDIAKHATEDKWVLVDPSQTIPWQSIKLDMPRYNKLLKELGYPDFYIWWRAAHKLHQSNITPWPPNHNQTNPLYMSAVDVLERLKAGPDAWVEYNWHRHYTVPERIRDCIKQVHDLTTVVDEKPVLHSWSAVYSHKQQHKRHGM